MAFISFRAHFLFLFFSFLLKCQGWRKVLLWKRTKFLGKGSTIVDTCFYQISNHSEERTMSNVIDATWPLSQSSTDCSGARTMATWEAIHTKSHRKKGKWAGTSDKPGVCHFQAFSGMSPRVTKGHQGSPRVSKAQGGPQGWVRWEL